MDEDARRKIAFLEGVTRFLRRSVTRRRLGWCSKHRAEHTGKICYLVVLDLHLARSTGREELLEEARAVALRTARRLGTDPRSGARVFLPGALDHRNAANHAIDSGAAVDCLATALIEAGDRFDAKDRAVVEEAVRACAATYLCDAARVKEIPAQRLWAATGLASAHALTGEETFKTAALDSLHRLLEDALPDGGIPYFPRAAAAGVHPGQSDISTYYHSRCIGFAFYVLRRLGMEPWAELDAFLERSLAFLCALYGGEGLKPLANEAKQWYWESRFEVASHTFDVHAFAEGYRRYGRTEFLLAATRAFDRMDRLRGRDGGIRSHGGRDKNFQCRLFWNAHAAWTARVLDGVPVETPAPALPSGPRVYCFPESGVAKVETAAYTLLLRGAKKPANIAFGSTVGGGCPVWFGTRSEGFRDRLGLSKWPDRVPGSFRVRPAGGRPWRDRLRAFFRENRGDLRFRFYVAWLEFTGGRPLFAVLYPLRHVVWKGWRSLEDVYASHWDCESRMEEIPEGLRFEGAPALRSGARLSGAREEREYRFVDEGVRVRHVLHLADAARTLEYTLPTLFAGLYADPVPLRIRRGRAIFDARIPSFSVEVRFFLPAGPFPAR